MPYYVAKTHESVCICCGKTFAMSNRNKISVCDECKDHGAICPVCGEPMPYGKKVCSYSCNGRNNMTNSNPMDNPESRKKISEKIHAHFDPIWGELRKQRAEERAEWEKHADEREAARLAKWRATRAKSGIPTGMARPEVKVRIMETAAKKGGMGLANPDAKRKARETSIARYGIPNPVKAPEVRKKISEKVKVFRNDPVVKAKAISTLQERYGISNGYLVGAESREPNFNSAAEKEIADFIESLGVTVVRHCHSLLGNREIDIYCPDYAIAIEYNGMYWHSQSVKQDKLYHYEKTKRCEERGVRLIHIYEWEWRDPVKQNILKSLLTVTFGKAKELVYARSCEIRDVPVKEYRKFCEENHLQGYRHATIIYGLYYRGELKQLMSFATPQKRGAKETFQWEIVRGCPGSNNVVVGGVSRLWKHFLREQNPESVMSYCDLNKFDGKSYLEIGMHLYRETPANVWYVENNTGKVQQWLFRNKEKREKLLATSFVVYGAGNLTFVWRKNENKIDTKG